MTTDRFAGFDIRERAHRAMIDFGFLPDFSPEALQQAADAARTDGALPSANSVRDLRSLLWSSIDNDDSLDLDQIEVAERLENGKIRVMVGIADVDALVKQDTPIDAHALHNKCSVYTGVAIYPMLPDQLSSDITSLRQDVDRASMVISMDIDENGEVGECDIFYALTRNRAKLAYDATGDWLEDEGPIPPAIAAVDGMEQQLRLQAEVSKRLRDQRVRSGALDFETIEAKPVMQDGKVVKLDVPRKNLARALIENLMISANTTMATYMERRNIPAIQRVVRTPARWPRIVELAARFNEQLPSEPDPLALSQFLIKRRAADPVHYPDLSLSVVKLLGAGEYNVVRSESEHLGHFGLAVHSYTHSTAPNRRFADVVIQRLIKATLAGAQLPYSDQALQEIAEGCTDRENMARKVERLMRKSAAALMMHNRIGQEFEGIVTGASYKGTYIRLVSPPVEGRVTANERGLDVGDRAMVRLLHTDPERGYIDFACLYEMHRH